MRYIFLFFISFIFLSCSSKTYTIEVHEQNRPDSIKRIALFLDGTSNDRDSRTNVSKMYEIIANHNLDNLYLFYNEGVGVGAKVIGAGIGWGFAKDVKEAYTFLSEYYSPESKLYLFGFSRGSYTARILAGMIQTVGIYNLKNLDKDLREEIVDELYYAYKGKDNSKKAIQEKVVKIIKKISYEKCEKLQPYKDVKIDVLAIWDTVEALGTTPSIEAIQEKAHIKNNMQNIINPNGRYYDQICDIKHVRHALSLDDNRAYVFTPIIISSKFITSKCDHTNDINISKRVKEVWFSGAHADIGGGYAYSAQEKGSLTGVSLNWMLKEISLIDDKLIPIGTNVYENRDGFIHNSEGYPNFNKILYRYKSRANILAKYADGNHSVYQKIKIHASVLDKLLCKKDTTDYDSQWYKHDYFSKCFNVDADTAKISFNECKVIEVVGERMYDNKCKFKK